MKHIKTHPNYLLNSLLGKWELIKLNAKNRERDVIKTTSTSAYVLIDL